MRCNFRHAVRGVVRMTTASAASVEMCFTADMSGRRIVEADTGTDEIIDIQIESLHMFGRDWYPAEIRAEFGNLAEWIIDQHDRGYWE